MKVVYQKNLLKKYVCTICGTQFNWSSKSSWYGQYDVEPEAYFCCNKCRDKYSDKIKF